MELTGKCKEEFFSYLWHNKTSIFKDRLLGDIEDLKDEFACLPTSSQNALIIDFFDWTGIIIQINNVCGDWWYRVKSESTSIHSQWFHECKSRSEATIQAIKKVNEIYNAKTS